MIVLTDELLLNYKRCSRRTYLEVYGDATQKDPQKEFILKLRKENKLHIQEYIQEQGLTPQRPQTVATNFRDISYQDKVAATIDLMAEGVASIRSGWLALTGEQWQIGLTNSQLKPRPLVNTPTISATPALESNPQKWQLPPSSTPVTLIANPTLLIKQPGKSCFGDWSYVPVNIKLGRRPKPEYKLIAAYHAQILAIAQNSFPDYSALILRQQNEHHTNLNHWLYRARESVAHCLEMLCYQQEPEVFISRQKCNLCQWYSHCYQEASKQKHLSLVPGITPKRYDSLHHMGLSSLEEIASTNERTLGKRIGLEIARQLQQQARSLLLDIPLIRSNFKLEDSVLLPSNGIELYFDIEAEPDRNLDYLLGILLVDRVNNRKQFYPFLAESAAEEETIWHEFFEFVSQYPNSPVYHFSGYEVDTIKRLAGLYGTPRIPTKALLARCVDIHQWVTRSVVLPVESYSLKSLANWLGFEWREETASGDQSVCWYDQWLTTQDRALLDAILSYNEDDCYATYYLKDWLEKFFLEAQQQASNLS